MPIIISPQTATTALKDDVCSSAEKSKARPIASLKDLSLRAVTTITCEALKLTTPGDPQAGGQISAIAVTATASGPASAAVPIVAGVATALGPRASSFAQRFSGSVEKILARGEELVLFRGIPANSNLKAVGSWWTTDPAIALRKAGTDGRLFVARADQRLLDRMRAAQDSGAEGFYQNYIVGPSGFPNATQLAQSYVESLRQAATSIGKLNQQMVRSILEWFD